MVRSRAVCVAAALLALTACAGGDKRPASVAPLVASSAPSASAATVAPTFPATREGAAAFVRYWFDVANRAARTGNDTLIGVVSTTSCRTCQGLEGLIRRHRGPYSFDPASLESARTAAVQAGSAVVTVFAAIRDSETGPARPHSYNALLARSGDNWLMRALERLK